jgi:hypothetical protein
MKKLFLIMFAALITGAFAQDLEIPGAVEEPAPVEMPAAPETLVTELEFKGINVFEYDLDLVFMDQDSNEVWFNEMSGDLSEMNLYTVEYNEGFPVYTVNKEAIGKKYSITYLEHAIEGEFPEGEEPPMIREVLAMEEVSQN